MLLRNFKTSADEVTKRNLANELLKVEIENEAILEDRIGNYKNPNAPPLVPPTYKTNSELAQDRLLQEKTAIDNLLSMDFDYSDATEIVKWLDNNIIKFNQGFPFIKSDIQKKFNPRLIDTSFMKDYLTKYFEEVNISFGFAFNKDNDITINTLTELKDILPSRQSLDDLINTIVTIGTNSIDGEVLRAILDQIHLLKNAILSDDEVSSISKISLYQRIQLFKKIANVVKSANIPRPAEIRELQIKLQKNQDRPLSIADLGVSIMRRFGGYSYKKLEPFAEIKKDIYDLFPPEVEEVVFNDEDITEGEPIILEESKIIEYKNNIINQLSKLGNEDEIKEAIKSTLHKIKLKTTFDYENMVPEFKDLKAETRKRGKSKGTSAYPIQDRINTLADVLVNIIDQQNQMAQEGNGKKYVAENREYYKNKENPSIGFGMKNTKALKNHFKEDEKFLKKVADELEDESSSDEEIAKALKKHAKAEKPYEKKIEKAVGQGYIHKRIPVKKIVGKGIEVQEQPTYKTFGKYVMHIPHLLNNNVLNLKYPSLGSIPAIKPMTISEDYKDFVIDVMNTGRVNDKAFSSLEPHERKHFERITKGAGLMDTFKLKKTSDEDDKADEARFNLLRGNYLGGNNSESVVKELKALVVKFISEGRIHRNEGMNLLMELSII